MDEEKQGHHAYGEPSEYKDAVSDYLCDSPVLFGTEKLADQYSCAGGESQNKKGYQCHNLASGSHRRHV